MMTLPYLIQLLIQFQLMMKQQQNKRTPESLYLLAAVLISNDLIDLTELLSYVSCILKFLFFTKELGALLLSVISCLTSYKPSKSFTCETLFYWKLNAT